MAWSLQRRHTWEQTQAHTHRYTMLQWQSECYVMLQESHAGMLAESKDYEVEAERVNMLEAEKKLIQW